MRLYKNEFASIIKVLIIYTLFSILILMSEDVFEEDKSVEKVLKEETLNEEDSSYDVSQTQSDSNQADAEKDNTGT